MAFCCIISLDRTFPVRVFSVPACCVIPADNGKNDQLEGESHAPSRNAKEKKEEDM